MSSFGGRKRAAMTWMGVGTAALLALTACGGSGSGGSGSGGGDPKEFSFLVNAENTTIPAELTTLSKDQCKAENDDLPLKIETVPQTQLDQKLQLLAGQDALPVSFAPGNTPELTATLDADGQLLDFEKTFSDLGVLDKVSPAAISTIKSLYGGKFNVLPYQYNIEGFWYNKKLFADNGIDVPQTWDDLVADAQKLDAAGVQPLSASGEQGWPLTRLISGYIFRELGPDAMKKVADGDAKLTDADYVKGAQAVADLGAQGYFGKGVGSIDYDTAINSFLSGDAGMLYMGSWVLGSFADDSLNKIGNDNIGFFPFPNVTAGAVLGPPVQRQGRRLAEVHRRELRAGVAGGPELHLRVRARHAAEAGPADPARPGPGQQHQGERPVVRGALRREGHVRQPDQRRTAGVRGHVGRRLHEEGPGRPRQRVLTPTSR